MSKDGGLLFNNYSNPDNLQRFLNDLSADKFVDCVVEYFEKNSMVNIRTAQLSDTFERLSEYKDNKHHKEALECINKITTTLLELKKFLYIELSRHPDILSQVAERNRSLMKKLQSQTPAQQFGGAPAQQFGGAPAQQFGGAPAQSYDDTPFEKELFAMSFQDFLARFERNLNIELEGGKKDDPRTVYLRNILIESNYVTLKSDEAAMVDLCIKLLKYKEDSDFSLTKETTSFLKVIEKKGDDLSKKFYEVEPQQLLDMFANSLQNEETKSDVLDQIIVIINGNNSAELWDHINMLSDIQKLVPSEDDLKALGLSGRSTLFCDILLQRKESLEEEYERLALVRAVANVKKDLSVDIKDHKEILDFIELHNAEHRPLQPKLLAETVLTRLEALQDTQLDLLIDTLREDLEKEDGLLSAHSSPPEKLLERIYTYAINTLDIHPDLHDEIERSKRA